MVKYDCTDGNPLIFQIISFVNLLLLLLEDGTQVTDEFAMVVDHSRKALNCVVFPGRGVCLMASILSSVGEIPSAEMIHPMKVTDFRINLHLLSCSLSPWSFRRLRMRFKFAMCSLSSFLVTRMSS